MNVIDAFLAPIYKYIILLLLICIVAYALSNRSMKLELANADKAKVKAVADAIQPFKDAEVKAQHEAQKAGEKYEKNQQTENTKTETINNTVQKITERTIYLNTCFDDDGVSAVNSAGDTE